MAILLNDQEKQNIKRGIVLYQKIRDYLKTDGKEIILSDSFQKSYDCLYKVRRGKQWRNSYFKLMFEKYGKPTSFESILNALNVETKRVEASFASKMLHTLDNDSPIWDKKVINFLVKKGVITRPRFYDKNRLEKRKNTFQALQQWFSKPDNIKEYVDCFNREFKDEYIEGITDIKKADFIIWGKL